MTGEEHGNTHPGTPAQAWATLMEGNMRFVESLASHPNQDAARRASLRACCFFILVGRGV